MGCSVSVDALQYRLEESVSDQNTQQLTQLFTYLLTHKLFSSCSRWYLMARTCDWVMLPCYILSVSNSVCFSSMSEARQLQRHMWFTQYRTLDMAENVSSTFLVHGIQPRRKTLNWF